MTALEKFWDPEFWNNTYRGSDHRGLDISPYVATGNRKVTALTAGTVVFIGHAPGGHLGLVIVVRVSSSVYLAYCHVGSVSTLDVGDKITRGDIIGNLVLTKGVDSGIMWTGPHCHLVSSQSWAAAWNPSYFTRDPAPLIRAALEADAQAPSIPAGETSSTITESEQDMFGTEIKYFFRYEGKGAPIQEYMITGVQLGANPEDTSGLQVGYWVTTKVEIAQAWGIMFGKPDGDAWLGLPRSKYMATQSQARRVYAAAKATFISWMKASK